MATAEPIIPIMNLVAIIISIVSLVVSSGVFILHFRRDRRESLAFEKANALIIRFTFLKALYNEYKGHDQMTGNFFEEYLLKILYQIQNNSNFPIIIDKVYLIFKNPESGKHYSTITLDFSNGQVVINSFSLKNFEKILDLKKAEKISEIDGLSITIRVLVRGSRKPISNNPQKFTIEYEDE
ncbi:hypothetical protein Q4534_02595 [Cyclobacterium sp. 1_MG-2023]|uniref:hypothetical protein n=1 Tax=Cyclobacterium sp. 1_MG-2023 TaxID=3062681 RepID=UPI0026E2A83C|nr:hypothetical protein [Cyclobacterium sp. 1_MG-2023]MDO6436275.1 hypothetical protein [Cyclobacterium sp. 1_MG-2023]